MKRTSCSLLLCLLLVSSVPAIAQERSVVEVPLRARDGYLLVPVTAPDGTVLDFGLATGSPPTALSESTAARFGETAELALGGLAIPTEGRQVRPDDWLSPGGEPIAGMLGAAFLSSYELLVDLPGGRLLLREIGPPAPWHGVELSEPVRIQILHGTVPSLTSRVGGQEFFTLLDLSTTTSVVSPALVAKLGLESEGEVTVGIGATELAGQPYVERDLEMFRRFDPDGNGFVILGATLVRDCALAISWTRGEIRTCVR